MWKEFKDFAMRGNVVDMAVGIVIGTAFGKIVASLVSDVIMPPIGLLLGGIDFSSFALVLREKSEGAEAVLLNYGLFINTVINFVIVAAALFLVVKGMNQLKRKQAETPAPPPEPSAEVVLLTEIRDALRAR